MALHPHLPPAVDYLDIASLRNLGDEQLAAMLAECRRWCRNLEDFRASLTTPVAHTLWKALIVAEVVLVAESRSRIEAEIAERMRDAACGAG